MSSKITRPGRFNEEPELKQLNEWQRVSKLTSELQNRLKIEFITLDSLITKKNYLNNDNAQRINSISMPVPVKKQPKYNISRWAVTGRDDFTLNTSCHKIYNHFEKNEIIRIDKWKELLNSWSIIENFCIIRVNGNCANIFAYLMLHFMHVFINRKFIMTVTLKFLKEN